MTRRKPHRTLPCDGGQVYLTGLVGSNTLNMKWGSGADQQCQVSYTLAKQITDSADV
ncbi:FimD/PapC C-terminal domain-containing protein [Serratia fonticola]|uniref:FimD/PapC C-terminal domain-containing protein n=1 Tax=Serratia fonticola TaxID=47917 RepID=UPI0034C5E859